MTSADLWTRYMGNHGHAKESNDDDFRWSKAKAPASWDVDRQKKFDLAWAKIAPLLKDEPEPVVVQTPREPPREIDTHDQATRETRIVETVTKQPAQLCVHSNKIKHRSKLWALEHRLRLARSEDERHPELLEVYKCQWCGAWHVGHRQVA